MEMAEASANARRNLQARMHPPVDVQAVHGFAEARAHVQGLVHSQVGLGGVM